MRPIYRQGTCGPHDRYLVVALLRPCLDGSPTRGQSVSDPRFEEVCREPMRPALTVPIGPREMPASLRLCSRRTTRRRPIGRPCIALGLVTMESMSREPIVHNST